MTHPPEALARVLALAAAGRNATDIARATGLNRRTVADWVNGKLPRGRSESDCAICGGPHDFHALGKRYAYLLGLYLGDGCLAAHPRGVFKLRIFLDQAYPGIINEACEAIDDVADRRAGRLMRQGDVEVYAYWKSWPCVLPQHGPGMKHHRPILLTDWQQRIVDDAPEHLLRGLIHSDGCRFINTGTNWVNPRYSFSNRSDDIRAIFCAACDRLGLHWTEAPYTVYVSRKDDVAVLDDFIGPKR